MSTTTSRPTAAATGTANGKQAHQEQARSTAAVRWLDDRLGVAKGGRTMLDKIFPDHWSFLLGEIALYSFVDPPGHRRLPRRSTSSRLGPDVIYHGVYVPLAGRQDVGRLRVDGRTSPSPCAAVSSSARCTTGRPTSSSGPSPSTCARIFFTGAFRKPRELNWFIGVTLLTWPSSNGFLGYSLPDDLVSGTGIRIASRSCCRSRSSAATWPRSSSAGTSPATGSIIPRFFILHVLVIPLILLGLIAGHLGSAGASRSTPSSPATAAPRRTWWARPCTPPSS